MRFRKLRVRCACVDWGVVIRDVNIDRDKNTVTVEYSFDVPNGESGYVKLSVDGTVVKTTTTVSGETTETGEHTFSHDRTSNVAFKIKVYDAAGTEKGAYSAGITFVK